MPITLGCPSCGKRFRARDESAGKKVKCPYCQAAVPVPTAEEAATAGAPTAPLPTPPTREPAPILSGPGSRGGSPSAPVVASPGDWGAVPTAPIPTAPGRPSASPEPDPAQFPPSLPAPVPTRGAKPRPKPAKQEGKKEAKTPEQVLAKEWASVRAGLFWVQFALLWLALLGFVGFGKAVYTRAVGELPKGEGWIKIDGYLNTPDTNAIQLSKREEINILAYGLPICIAGAALILGRLISSGGPRSSGSRGLLAWSGIFTLIAYLAFLIAFVSEKMLFKDEYRYSSMAFLVSFPLAEFLFLTGLVACGIALKRPKVARAVGLVGFVAALGAALILIGWEFYVQYGRPKKLDDEWRMYEQAGVMLGWLLLIGVYSRAVRGVRVAAREYLDTVEEG